MGTTETPIPSALASQWRERADLLREWGGGEDIARVWETAAAELETALRTEEAEVLTLQEAADESGYSPDHLGALVREGKLPNAGRKNSPRIRRADLPLKPHRSRSRSRNGRRDRVDEIVREIATSKFEEE